MYQFRRKRFYEFVAPGPLTGVALLSHERAMKRKSSYYEEDNDLSHQVNLKILIASLISSGCTEIVVHQCETALYRFGKSRDAKIIERLFGFYSKLDSTISTYPRGAWGDHGFFEDQRGSNYLEKNFSKKVAGEGRRAASSELTWTALTNIAISAAQPNPFVCEDGSCLRLARSAWLLWRCCSRSWRVVRISREKDGRR